MHLTTTLTFLSLTLVTRSVFALNLDLNSTSSIRTAAKTIGDSVIARYQNGTGIPGLFAQPYYFWESGLAWDSLINYQYLTGDTSYNKLIGDALTYQLSAKNDFMPANQTKTEGNDDQAYWALAAMTAAEVGFPEPHNSSSLAGTSWATIAQNVFDEQVARWDNATCNGGLRWQIFPFNNGYDYKNSMSTGAFFQLAARLGLYTGNTTYTDWAQTAYKWSYDCLLYTSPSPRDGLLSRMPSSA